MSHSTCSNLLDLFLAKFSSNFLNRAQARAYKWQQQSQQGPPGPPPRRSLSHVRTSTPLCGRTLFIVLVARRARADAEQTEEADGGDRFVCPRRRSGHA